MHTGTQQKEDALLELQRHTNQFVKGMSLSLQRQTCKQIFSILLSLFRWRKKWHACHFAWKLDILFWPCNHNGHQQQLYFLKSFYLVIYFPVIPNWQLLQCTYHKQLPFSRDRFTLLHASIWLPLGLILFCLAFQNRPKYETKHKDTSVGTTLMSASFHLQNPVGIISVLELLSVVGCKLSCLQTALYICLRRGLGAEF